MLKVKLHVSDGASHGDGGGKDDDHEFFTVCVGHVRVCANVKKGRLNSQTAFRPQ